MSTTTEQKTETHQFQAEVEQLLHLMIHSLYSNKEIFLRELISNASDACDRLRFAALADDSLLKNDTELKIQIEVDEAERCLVIRDNGIGMSREEVMKNIGTIARSGTREFLKGLNGDQIKDSRLIGQFGVGFYSSFIVANRVVLTTRRAGASGDDGVRWESQGAGSYEIEQANVAWRGTEIRLHLREEEGEFLNAWQLRSLIKKYSDHIPLPVQLKKLDEKGELTDEWETVNRASALWVRPKSEIQDREYKEFYEHLTHRTEPPLDWVHFRVEGKTEYTGLLYIPAEAPFDMFDQEQKHGIKLYVQRVFIMDEAEKLLPRYLRFLRGVVDSNDLPLNVSREILQGNKTIDSMRAGCTKRALGMLESMARDKPTEYTQFWKAFGTVFKEGPAEDFSNQEKIAELLRFASTKADSDEQTVSLADYIGRMPESQAKIYFITADSIKAAKHSPHLEVFIKKGIEVLLLHDRVDEWLVAHLHEFHGKPLQSVAKGELDLGDGEKDEQLEQKKKENRELLTRIRTVLGDKIEDVRVSSRLTKSPACIVLGEQDMALYMQRLLKQAGHDMPSKKPILEINPDHPILVRLKDDTDEARVENWSRILFDQAVLAEGGQLEDPAGFVHRLNDLILGMTQ